MKRKTLLFLSLSALLLSVPAQAADLYVGDTVEESMDGKNTIEREITASSDSERRSESDSDSSSSGGTSVEISAEEQAVIDSQQGVRDTLKDIISRIRSTDFNAITQDGNTKTYAGTGQMTESEYEAIKNYLSKYNDNVVKKGLSSTYNSNDLPGTISSDPEMTDSELTKAFKKIAKAEDITETGTSGTSTGGSSSGSTSADGSDTTGSGGSFGNTTGGSTGTGSSGSTGTTISPTLIDNNGKLTIDTGTSLYPTVRYDPANSIRGIYLKDILTNGAYDFAEWNDRYSQLVNYWEDKTSGTGTSTALADYEDIAYVESYYVSEIDRNYYKISDYTSSKRHWTLYKDGVSDPVKEDEGDIDVANITFTESGTYTLSKEQWATITTGKAVTYYKRSYLILIPTNTLLYFKEEAIEDPVFLNKSVEEGWVPIETKTFKVNDLGNISNDSSITERTE